MAPRNDGQDTFTVNQLRSMESYRPFTNPDNSVISRRDTLDLDGQAGTDTYTINTTGSMGTAVGGLGNAATTSSTSSTPGPRTTASIP